MKPKPLVFVRFERLHQHRSGAVAEQDAGAAIGVIDDAAHGVGSNYQHFLVCAAAHQVRGSGQAVNEARAGCNQVESPGAFGSQPVLYEARCRGEEHVRRNGANQDRVELCGIDTALIECPSCRLDGQIGGRGIWRRDVTFGDPGPSENPLVRCLDHLLQILIREHPLGNVAAERADFDFTHRSSRKNEGAKTLIC